MNDEASPRPKSSAPVFRPGVLVLATGVVVLAASSIACGLGSGGGDAAPPASATLFQETELEHAFPECQREGFRQLPHAWEQVGVKEAARSQGAETAYRGSLQGRLVVQATSGPPVQDGSRVVQVTTRLGSYMTGLTQEITKLHPCDFLLPAAVAIEGVARFVCGGRVIVASAKPLMRSLDPSVIGDSRAPELIGNRLWFFDETVPLFTDDRLPLIAEGEETRFQGGRQGVRVFAISADGTAESTAAATVIVHTTTPADYCRALIKAGIVEYVSTREA